MPLTHNSDSLETRNLTVHDVLMLGEATTMELRQMASPVAPPAGSLALFAKTDGKLYVKDTSGTEIDITTAGGLSVPVAIGEGGTGATTAPAGRVNLGLAIGVNVAAATHQHAAEEIASGTLSGDRLAAKNRTVTKIVYIESPNATDVFPIAFLADAVTLVEVRGVTDAGSVDFNVEHRATNTPGAPGTVVMASDLQATSAGALMTTFADATVPAARWLAFTASSLAGSPGKLWVALVYRID